MGNANLESFKEAIISSDQNFATFLILVAVTALVWYAWSGQLKIKMSFLNVLVAGKLLPVTQGITSLYAGLVAPLSMGAIIRLIQMNDVMWFDESFSAALVKLPLAQMFEVIRADVHPPTHYLIQWAFVRLFGHTEIVLRLPALLAGIAFIYLTYRLTLALKFSHRAAIVAAWIMAYMPAAVKYANEARQYALLSCLVFGLMIALLERRRLWFMVLGVLGAWTHNLGFFYLGVLGIAALYHNRAWLWFHNRAWFWTVIKTWGIAALWLPALLYQAGEVADGFWLGFTWPGALMPLFNMTLTNSIPMSLYMFAGVPFLTVMSLSVCINWRWLRTKPGIVWLALFFGVPFSVALVSWLWHPIYLHRALLPAVLAIVPIMGHFLVTAQRGRTLWLLSVMFALFLGIVGFFAPGRSNTPEGRDMARFCAGSDAIYSTGVITAFLADFYLPGVPNYLAPTVLDDQGMHLKQYALDALNFQIVDDPTAIGDDVCILVLDNPWSHGGQYVLPYLKPGEFKSDWIMYHVYYAISYFRIGDRHM